MIWWDYGFPRYVSVAERKSRAQRTLKQLKQKGELLQPVEIEGRQLAKTWWGKAWNANLESYADFSNRIGRGRSYLRSGCVVDLKILAGKVSALVAGSASRPYVVEVKIQKLRPIHWRALKTASRKELRSVIEPLEGNFPKNLGEIFIEKKTGLFPAPKEIHLDCSCPDGAWMCKHLAAVLYGIGVRLDEDPELFFILRGVKLKDLISSAVKEEKKSLLEKTVVASSKRLIKSDDSALSSLFGIEFDAGQAGDMVSKKKNNKKKNSPPRSIKRSRSPKKKIKVIKKVKKPRR